MFIINNLENLIFAKNTEEPKKESNISNQVSGFREIFNNALNGFSRLEADGTSANFNNPQDLEGKNANLEVVESFNKTEIFNERLGREEKVESFAATVDNSQAEEKISTFSIEQESDTRNENLEEIGSGITVAGTLDEQSDGKNKGKEVPSVMLLHTFLGLDTSEMSLAEKTVSKKVKPEAKADIKTNPAELGVVKKDFESKTEGIHNKSEPVLVKESGKKEIKGSELRALTNDIELTKSKEVKVVSDLKELLPRDGVGSKETSREFPKIERSEDNFKQTQSRSKIKESSITVEKNISDTKIDLPLSDFSGKSLLASKGNDFSGELLNLETRKLKKTSEADGKEKLNLENPRPVLKDMGAEKDFRFIKETLVEISGLDKNKWTITRREKDMEASNVERRKESLTLLNEISSKSSSSQTPNDSDKSFSNSRSDFGSFKTFSENLKTANSDKPRETVFDRENFSRSLNDLVNKARVNIVENGRNTAQISLYPKDLGKMTLNIDVVKEKVEGKILVDSEFIKNRLLGDVSQLKADLKANGLDLQSISIEVRSEGSLAFDFANPSSEKDTSKKDSKEVNTALPQGISQEEALESEFSNKSYKLVDIKI